jgi:hypothetical protein
MAQVAPEHDVRARAEHFLDYSLREWAAVPEYAAEFDKWGEVQQLSFVHEWAIRESALEILAEYTRQGALTEGQRKRYEELLTVVNRNRPQIEELLEG